MNVNTSDSVRNSVPTDGKNLSDVSKTGKKSIENIIRERLPDFLKKEEILKVVIPADTTGNPYITMRLNGHKFIFEKGKTAYLPTSLYELYENIMQPYYSDKDIAKGGGVKLDELSDV
jgi:hypothetical protein